MMKPSALPLWDFKWNYNGTDYTAVFVGTDPARGSATTKVPVYIIPVEMTYGSLKENPNKLVKGTTVTKLTITSPIFEQKNDYKQGGTDLGKTQYEDAFQRGALWGYAVSKNTDYHVLLGKPKVEKLLKLKVPANEGTTGSPFGTEVVEASYGWFDGQIRPLVANYPPDSLPIFLTTNTYLLEGSNSGCCIGGYHYYTGTQAYSMATFIQATGQFSQDVSALSHEVGEWMDDPLIDNGVACGIYEVGDPLEGGQPGHPYGTWVYHTHGYTYHLQDLVFPPYFGAPTSTSVNGQFTFQGYTGLGVCSNGG
jgi:hypothetical protein